MERLQKIIANSGICSRRKAEELILAGKVKVNGEVIYSEEVVWNPKTTEDPTYHYSEIVTAMKTAE